MKENLLAPHKKRHRSIGSDRSSCKRKRKFSRIRTTFYLGREASLTPSTVYLFPWTNFSMQTARTSVRLTLLLISFRSEEYIITLRIARDACGLPIPSANVDRSVKRFANVSVISSELPSASLPRLTGPTYLFIFKVLASPRLNWQSIHVREQLPLRNLNVRGNAIRPLPEP